MQLHYLQSLLKREKRKRIGRGGKRGTTSGRGQKGQKSRAGRRIRPAERDLILRIPKRRGFRNKPRGVKPEIVNLGQLRNFTGLVEPETLRKAGLIKRNSGRAIKILGGGEIEKPIIVKNLMVSKSAKTKIEKAGGRVEGFVQKSAPNTE